MTGINRLQTLDFAGTASFRALRLYGAHPEFRGCGALQLDFVSHSRGLSYVAEVRGQRMDQGPSIRSVGAAPVLPIPP